MAQGGTTFFNFFWGGGYNQQGRGDLPIPPVGKTLKCRASTHLKSKKIVTQGIPYSMMVFLVSLFLSTHRTMPKPRQTAISTCRHNDTNVAEYRYVSVDISVCRHIGMSTLRDGPCAPTQLFIQYILAPYKPPPPPATSTFCQTVDFSQYMSIFR